MRLAMAEIPMLYANFTALSSLEPELLLTEVVHCGNREFRVFAAMTLTLTRYPSYTNLTRIL